MQKTYDDRHKAISAWELHGGYLLDLGDGECFLLTDAPEDVRDPDQIEWLNANNFNELGIKP